MKHPQLQIIFSSCQSIMGMKWIKKNRRREYVYKRAIFYQVARRLTGASLSDIGAFIDRDHATVLHGLKRFKIDIEEGYGIDVKVYQDFYKRALRQSEKMLNHYKKNEWSYEQRLVHENINLRDKVKTLKETIKTLVA